MWPRREAEEDPEYVGWRDADLRVRQPRAGLRVVRFVAWSAAITGFVVLLMEVQRDPDRCHPNCFDGSDNTREAGHVWTGYDDSWQWEAQLVRGWAALVLALWALYATGKRELAEGRVAGRRAAGDLALDRVGHGPA